LIIVFGLLLCSKITFLFVKAMTCDLYYKPITIVNDDSMVINKLEASLTDDTRVIIYDCHVFIAQATGYSVIINFDTFSVASSTFNDKFKKNVLLPQTSNSLDCLL
jgi:hypothetical protein